MTETVRTSANNQLKQKNQKEQTTEKALFKMATNSDACDALRLTKGNLWQAIKQVLVSSILFL